MAVIVTTWRNDQPWLRPLLCAYFLTIVCIFTCFVTVRLSAVGFKRIRRLSFARLLLLFVLVDSYLFGFCTTLMLFGVNPASSPRSCSATMWICVWVYGFTKIGMFTFLVERLRAVTSHTTALLDDRFLQRLKNPWYSIGLSILVFWVAGAGVLIAGNSGVLRDDGKCILGVEVWVAAPILAIELVANLYLSFGFVYQIWRTGFTNSQRLARNSLVAALFGLVITCANVIIMLRGKRLVYICLASCMTDTCLNAILLFALTQSRDTTKPDEFNSAASVTVFTEEDKQQDYNVRIWRSGTKPDAESGYESGQPSTRTPAIGPTFSGGVEQSTMLPSSPRSASSGGLPRFVRQTSSPTSLASRVMVTAEVARTVEAPEPGEISTEPSDHELYPPKPILIVKSDGSVLRI